MQLETWTVVLRYENKTYISVIEERSGRWAAYHVIRDQPFLPNDGELLEVTVKPVNT